MIFHNWLQLQFYYRVLLWILFFPLHLNFCHCSINVKLRKKEGVQHLVNNLLRTPCLLSFSQLGVTSEQVSCLITQMSSSTCMNHIRLFYVLAINTSLQNIWKFKSDVTGLQKCWNQLKLGPSSAVGNIAETWQTLINELDLWPVHWVSAQYWVTASCWAITLRSLESFLNYVRSRS